MTFCSILFEFSSHLFSMEKGKQGGFLYENDIKTTIILINLIECVSSGERGGREGKCIINQRPEENNFVQMNFWSHLLHLT